LRQELVELQDAHDSGSLDQIRHEAVDVANLAMMIFDQMSNAVLKPASEGPLYK
jgi:hypothetical protein